MTYFEPGTDEREQLGQMLELASRHLSGRTGVPWPRDRKTLPDRVIALVEQSRLPPGALALVAGSCAAFDTIKDYGLRRYWDYALTSSTHAPPRLATMKTRVALVGAMGQFWDVLQVDRFQLYEWRGRPEIDDFLLAVDAVWGARRAAVDALVARSGAAPACTWLGWLAEAAQRIARADEIRDAIPSEPMALTIPAIAEGRDFLCHAPFGEEADAWAVLAQAPDPVHVPEPLPPMPADTPPEVLKIVTESWARSQDASAEDLKAWGPLGSPPPPEVRQPIIGLGWRVLVGFRQLYGIELARAGAAECAAWLAGTMPTA